jgi:hypothetical protein
LSAAGKENHEPDVNSQSNVFKLSNGG